MPRCWILRGDPLPKSVTLPQHARSLDLLCRARRDKGCARDDKLERSVKRFLVAPRGHTQWVRNAEAAGEVTLKKGSKRERFGLRALSDEEKPEILKAYLDQFRREVQTYFPVPAGSPAEAFRGLLQSYPAFELTPK